MKDEKAKGCAYVLIDLEGKAHHRINQEIDPEVEFDWEEWIKKYYHLVSEGEFIFPYIEFRIFEVKLDYREEKHKWFFTSGFIERDIIAFESFYSVLSFLDKFKDLIKPSKNESPNMLFARRELQNLTDGYRIFLRNKNKIKEEK